jgi:rfaE bifunctional protein nucleotidyltransferase chain/domain
MHTHANSKFMDLEELLNKVRMHREAWDTIVFTNGCFDILHAGHVRYLSKARTFGDFLIVGLNSDASVRKIKGDKRPVVSQDHRAEVLAGLGCVNYVVLFEEPDPLLLIKAIQPDVLVKGADWEEDEIIGADEAKAAGGRVVRIPLVPEISTSKIIDRVIELNT